MLQVHLFCHNVLASQTDDTTTYDRRDVMKIAERYMATVG